MVFITVHLKKHVAMILLRQLGGIMQYMVARALALITCQWAIVVVKVLI
jgi:hypothetical protein